MKLAFSFMILLPIFSEAFLKSPLSSKAISVRMSESDCDSSWKKRLATGILSTIFIGSTILPPQIIVAPVLADFRAAQKRTFFRFTPKVRY